jgi:dihydrofolate synthase/folylpolyglutamate synthase
VNRADQILRSREALGWRLGLERMRRLCSLLGLPQHRFTSVHVVGTNGKTSVARMLSAVLEAHGIATATYTSPHLRSWRERYLVRGEPIEAKSLAAAVERAEQAAAVADRAAGEDGPVTQFELATAAAFLAFTAAGVDLAVVEAGLGGRLDATNVIPSRVTVLTSVGLDHTDWLGETLGEIAAEKVAVLRDHTVLVAGELPPEAEDAMQDALRRRHARLVRAVPEPPEQVAGLVPAGYQRRNLALALATAEALLGELALDGVRGTASGLMVPGRAELRPGEPPVLLDAAHNPDGAEALAEALAGLAGGRQVICCFAVLADKDAPAMARALAPRCAAAVCTEVPEEALRGSGRPGGRSRAARELAALFSAEGVDAEAVEEPAAAWVRARELARERRGVALATGSHYLVGFLE